MVGESVGNPDGSKVGGMLGIIVVGAVLGSPVGLQDGVSVGSLVGFDDGCTVGKRVVGPKVGSKLVGADVGTKPHAEAPSM